MDGELDIDNAGGVKRPHPSQVNAARNYRVESSTSRLIFFLSVLQHGPRVSLGCRSNEFQDHAKT
jgi:hypothetical protein